ncbi:hypothetical protein HOF40_00655 [Candidatus Parcubacteria bacterium]|jgi:hypothetical protein|nr:hypothetical protein [Candidatus Parcubacteria bacterium]MBT3948580.1 hypothetical protein [Candidatus Parcubacteria bacterium]
MNKEYVYEPIGTVLTDYDDGRLFLIYGRPGKDATEVREQGAWLGDTLEKIHNENPKRKYTMLVDLDKLLLLRLDDISREIYREIIKRSYLKKIAIAGDAFSYTKILPLLVMTRFRRTKAKFFMNIACAYKWLKWK